jgi:hypothetical protein
MPADAPHNARHTAQQCWHFNPGARPSMRKVIKYLQLIDESPSSSSSSLSSSSSSSSSSSLSSLSESSSSLSEPLDEIFGVGVPRDGDYDDLIDSSDSIQDSSSLSLSIVIE